MDIFKKIKLAYFDCEYCPAAPEIVTGHFGEFMNFILDPIQLFTGRSLFPLPLMLSISLGVARELSSFSLAAAFFLK